jgi:hypothetical protein
VGGISSFLAIFAGSIFFKSSVGLEVLSSSLEEGLGGSTDFLTSVTFSSGMVVVGIAERSSFYSAGLASSYIFLATSSSGSLGFEFGASSRIFASISANLGPSSDALAEMTSEKTLHRSLMF